jgi:carbonic anhydrase
VNERTQLTRPLTTAEILAHNEDYVREQFVGMRPLRPARETAVVACMDSRMAVFALLGLQPGDAHIIRNAGGVVTDDVIRSLVLSQRAMGTRSIVIVQHTDCGLMKISEDQMRAAIEAETGVAPRFVFEAFRDPFANVRQSIRRLRGSPFLPHHDEILGFVYAVETGQLHPVPMEGP